MSERVEIGNATLIRGDCIACRRIERAQAQGVLFDPRPDEQQRAEQRELGL